VNDFTGRRAQKGTVRTVPEELTEEVDGDDRKTEGVRNDCEK
jgi:hypothetical protein